MNNIDSTDAHALRCELCGNIQQKGEWENAMDAQARAMGSKGFINLGAQPQCLKCGSRELRDLSVPVLPEEEPRIVSEAAEEIVVIMAPYFLGAKHSAFNEEAGGEQRVVAIGKALYENGGHEAMFAAFTEARNLAHRRFGYTESARLLEMVWDGVGEWMG